MDDRRPDPPGRSRRRLAVPLASLASPADVEDAIDILDIHQARPVVRRLCAGCGDPWPCTEILFAWAVTGIPPANPPPG